jgi:hypothetical protein
VNGISRIREITAHHGTPPHRVKKLDESCNVIKGRIRILFGFQKLAVKKNKEFDEGGRW